MIYLFLSIGLSILTVSYFKLFERYQVNTLQAIIVNYFVCILIGNATFGEASSLQSFWQTPWLGYAIILGFLFVSIFYCIGITTQKMGVSVSMVAAKLSVVIPICFAFFLQGEKATYMKIIGVIVSLISIYFISKKETTSTINLNKFVWLLPICVFVGSGVIDSLLKQMQFRFIPPYTASHMLRTAFLFAFLFGSILLIYKREAIALKSIFWGIALGFPNYFCMFFLLKTLQFFDASIIFPINNLAIVVGATLVSISFFGEKLTFTNWLGIAMAIASITIISLADVVF